MANLAFWAFNSLRDARADEAVRSRTRKQSLDQDGCQTETVHLRLPARQPGRLLGCVWRAGGLRGGLLRAWASRRAARAFGTQSRPPAPYRGFVFRKRS